MSRSTTPPVLWRPSREGVERARLTAFSRWVAARHGVSAADYDSLWRWSVDDLEVFWESIWEYFEVSASAPYARVLDSRRMPGARWFEGARLSYAEHLGRGRAGNEVAIRHASERRGVAEVTWGELRAAAGAMAAGLRSLGVGEGDRVVAYLPNIPEAIVAFWACASLGAIWSSCSPDFGARAVIDRFAQIEPKVLLAVDGYRYGGRDFDRRDVVNQVRAGVPSLRHTVLLPYLGSGPIDGAVPWAELEGRGRGAALEFAQLAFDHPLWVLYSSGTTGLPKPIVHSQGGILLEHLKKLCLHVDAQPGDRVFWYTTTGWMMWNFLVGGLLSPASIVLYDGRADGALWDLAARAGVTCFGTSAGYIGACAKDGVAPAAGRDLSALRAVGSTGSPLSPEGFRWVYDSLGGDTWLFSTSGGTDVCTAFVGGVPTLPVYEGELQARALGARVEAWDPRGRPLVGQVGELVITEPMPSMPVRLWGDADGSRLLDTYFSMYPGVWRHGDWIEITDRGTAVIYGRSDSTINRGGVRMGTSEIYRAILAMDEIVDALVVDVPREGGDSWMPLFVVPREGVELDGDLVARIKARIREECSPRHVPSEVVPAPEIPRTLSGKVLEVPVKRILAGVPPERAASRDSLANPAALDWFVTFGNHGVTMAPMLGTKEKPWPLKTPPGTSDFQMYRDESADPPALVCTVGKTELRYRLRCIDDLHAMLKAHGDWMPLGSADEQKPATEGTVEAWGRSPDNPVGGWYGLKKGLRGRFAMYVPPLMEALGLAELEHNPRNNRMRAL